MIEIKEEDIVMDSLHRGLLIQITSKEECKQLKQQILQDHEGAKKWEKLNSAFPNKVDWSKLEYFAVKEVGDISHVAQLFDENKDISRPDLLQIKKDRQIVKRLEEEIKDHNKKLNEIIKIENGTKSCGSDFHLRLLDNRDNLQKILEGKK